MNWWRAVAIVVFVVAGALFVTSSLASRGLDLRASSVTDLDTVVRQEGQRTDDLQGQVGALTREVNALGENVDDAQVSDLQDDVAALRGPAGFEEVHGPAVTVVLSDAPKDEINSAVENGEVTADQLVVHQQDIQAVVNALWSGGAEAMTIQGQRVISTTGVKCVGNTVVLHGIPYAPPYVVSAIGDQARLQAALASSRNVGIFKQYVDAYGLQYRERLTPRAQFPGHQGSLELQHAQPHSEGSPSAEPPR